MYKIGWFSTGRDEAACHLLTEVVKKIDDGTISGRISFVFSNREMWEAPESDEFLKLVQNYEFPLVCFSSKRFLPELRNRGLREGIDSNSLRKWRIEYDRQVMLRLGGCKPDLCVLAGYMLIVGPEMCNKYQMINLHPALPGGPVGTWQEVIWELIKKRAAETGVTIHLVTPELDRGPAITYCAFPIFGGNFDKFWEELELRLVDDIRRKEGEDYPLFKLIRTHGVVREIPLIVLTVKALTEGKIRIKDGKVFGPEGEIRGGYNMSQDIEEIVEEVRL